MSMAYENRRDQFDELVKKYNDYVLLYKIFNNGSTEGLASFADFYWRMTYLADYQDPSTIVGQGY